jgi:hypothetical protein
MKQSTRESVAAVYAVAALLAVVMLVMSVDGTSAATLTHRERAFLMRDRAIAQYRIDMVSHGLTPDAEFIRGAYKATDTVYHVRVAWYSLREITGVTWHCGDEVCVAGLGIARDGTRVWYTGP